MSDSFVYKFNEVKKNSRVALIPFITAGFPDKKNFWEELKELDENGADIIEIGVPFSDPVADGPVIEAASLKAIQEGVDIKYILDGLAQRKFNSPLVLMGYFNPFYKYGLKKLIEDCSKVGVKGLIIPDLPLEEYQRYFPKQSKVRYIPLIGLNTSIKRMKAYAELDPPFVYIVSVLGITGNELFIEDSLLSLLEKIKKIFSCPVVLGFGLSNPTQIKPIISFIDGVVFGTSLLRFLNNGGKSREFLQKWKI
ncbi:tryptophan synthase, alpha chain [Desulfonauticus submarinus]|uniref:Tryptophan synthase alpha chain n=1 Tax=Desulfonauticus submarinus TaxID=206665 RepID=A0A1H0BHR6_9BACT|nr:tryptophan synthase subunit alpha [Desulfonauticus submarinus]SDN45162.1 tryptophan synthase, alpha chain [Desulfonauticus submarinus]